MRLSSLHILVVIFFSTTTYEITDKEIIRYYNKMSGLRIYIPDIPKVEHLPKGLKIWYSQKDFVWVKVEEEKAFLAHLKQINPAIHFV